MWQTKLSNDSARLILALGRQRTKMAKSWQKLAVELAIKAIYEYETGVPMQWASQRNKPDEQANTPKLHRRR